MTTMTWKYFLYESKIFFPPLMRKDVAKITG